MHTCKTKRVIIIFSILLLLFSILGTVVTATGTFSSDKKHTACFTYNLRSSASASSTSLELVSKGVNRTSPNVTADSYRYSLVNWMKLNTSSGVSGYARCDMVCPRTRCYKVTAENGLRLHVTSDLSSSTICTLPKGTYVMLEDTVNSGVMYVFVRTNYEGYDGFVSSDYLEYVNN